LSQFFKTKALHAAAAEVTEMDAAPFDLRDALCPWPFFREWPGHGRHEQSFPLCAPRENSSVFYQGQKKFKNFEKIWLQNPRCGVY